MDLTRSRALACRLVQGIAIGGIDKRGFYGSLVQIGFPLGTALDTASFFALAYLSDEQFTSWGWRIPLLASAALVVIGIFTRLQIQETPDFKRVMRDASSRAIQPLKLDVQFAHIHHSKRGD